MNATQNMQYTTPTTELTDDDPLGLKAERVQEELQAAAVARLKAERVQELLRVGWRQVQGGAALQRARSFPEAHVAREYANYVSALAGSMGVPVQLRLTGSRLSIYLRVLRQPPARIAAVDSMIDFAATLGERPVMPNSSISDTEKEWETLLVTTEVNSKDLEFLEEDRVGLAKDLEGLKEARIRQKSFKAQVQQATRDLEGHLESGRDHATRLRNGVRTRYGLSNEKLTEFGLNPRRRKARQQKPQEPVPSPTAPTAAPVTSAPVKE